MKKADALRGRYYSRRRAGALLFAATAALWLPRTAAGQQGRAGEWVDPDTVPLPASPQTAPAPDGEALIDRIEDYLNDFMTLKADFMQISPDGSERYGQLFLDRPNRIRFQYDAPYDNLLIVGRGSWIYVLDYELGDQSRFPAEETPLRFIMRVPVRFDDDEVEITDIDTAPGHFAVTAVDRIDPRQGSLQLVFENDPMRLRNWIITDGRGDVTAIALSNLEPDIELDKDLFDFEKPGRRN